MIDTYTYILIHCCLLFTLHVLLCHYIVLLHNKEQNVKLRRQYLPLLKIVLKFSFFCTFLSFRMSKVGGMFLCFVKKRTGYTWFSQWANEAGEAGECLHSLCDPNTNNFTGQIAAVFSLQRQHFFLSFFLLLFLIGSKNLSEASYIDVLLLFMGRYYPR